jgi:hypothetical protein
LPLLLRRWLSVSPLPFLVLLMVPHEGNDFSITLYFGLKACLGTSQGNSTNGRLGRIWLELPTRTTVWRPD